MSLLNFEPLHDKPSGYFYEVRLSGLAASGGSVCVALTFMSGRAWFHPYPAHIYRQPALGL